MRVSPVSNAVRGLISALRDADRGTPSGGSGPAAIAYVGGQTNGKPGDTSSLVVPFALTGGVASLPAEGDLVLITCVAGTLSQANPPQAIPGYENLGQVFVDSTNDLAMNVSYKRMTGTPDTEFTVPSPGSASHGQAWAVQVFRGVDPLADLSTLFATSNSTSSPMPDPPSRTPTVPGSWVAICGGCSVATGALFTAPTNFVENFLTFRVNDTADAVVGCGYWSGWASGAVDPGVYGNWGGAGASAAYTLVLPPG